MGCMSVLEGEEKCPRCGSPQNNRAFSREYLPPRTELAKRYLVGKLVAQNGEGAIYIGYDLEEERKLYISEYFPRTLSRRNEADSSVAVRYGKEPQFKTLLYDFLENAEILQDLCVKNAGLVPVLETLSENGTAYVIYRYIQAVPLSEYLLENGGELSWAQAKPMFMPLLKTLSALHKKGAIHRGVSPETLLVDSKGRLWLFGFAVSAARTASSELDGELFEGYAAPEQYAANGKQGAWTDVYSAAAVAYRALTGTMPVSAEIRKEKDSLYPANMLSRAVPPNVSEALDNAMEVQPEKRTQTIDQLVSSLLEAVDSNTAVFDAKEYVKPASSAGGEKRRMPFWLKVMLITTAGLAVFIIVLYFTVIGPSLTKESEAASLSELEQQMSASEEAASKPEPVDVSVPNFSGQFVQRVQNNPAYAVKYQFKVEERYNEDGIAPGVVYDQSPAAGTPMLNKGTVILFVSKGSQIVQMPYLVGSTVELAGRTLADMNIYMDVIYEESETVEPDLVIRTSVEPYTSVTKEKDMVYLYVSSKPVTIEEEEP